MPVQPENLPPPYQVNSIGLLLTLKCNAQCSHCCFSCHPLRKEKMTLTRAVNYVNQAAQVETVTSITLTGGEVFTCYDLLQSVIEAAGTQGLQVRLVSNGYWATTVKKARKKLVPLVNGGLTTINLSSDTFHEQFVAPERIKNAAEAALELGLNVAIAHTSLGISNQKNAETILHSLGLDTSLPITIFEGQINPGGRAATSFSLDQLGIVDGESEKGKRLQDVCSYVVREPVIAPNGDFSACCGTTIAASPSFKKEFIVGNLNKNPLPELVEIMELDPLYVGLMVEGPWYFYQRLNKLSPKLFPRKKFTTVCDLCNQVVCRSAAQGILQDILIQDEPKLLIKKMMLEAGRQEMLSAQNKHQGTNHNPG